jgi:hypothetical protein
LKGSNIETVNRITLLSTSSVIAGESLLLLIGMNIPSQSEWVSAKNVSFAISDILLGGYLIYTALFQQNLQNSPLYYSLSSLLLLTHGYRDYEYLTNTSNSYCANKPLFILNNVRMFGTALSLGFTVTMKF